MSDAEYFDGIILPIINNNYNLGRILDVTAETLKGYSKDLKINVAGSTPPLNCFYLYWLDNFPKGEPYSFLKFDYTRNLTQKFSKLGDVEPRLAIRVRPHKKGMLPLFGAENLTFWSNGDIVPLGQQFSAGEYMNKMVAELYPDAGKTEDIWKVIEEWKQRKYTPLYNGKISAI